MWSRGLFKGRHEGMEFKAGTEIVHICVEGLFQCINEKKSDLKVSISLQSFHRFPVNLFIYSKFTECLLLNS